MDVVIQVNHRIKLKESGKKDKYIDLAREWKKTMEHERENYTNLYWCFWFSHQRIIKGTRGLGSRRTIGDHPNDDVIENGQNTEKSSGDSRRLAVAHTPLKDHQLM